MSTSTAKLTRWFALVFLITAALVAVAVYIATRPSKNALREPGLRHQLNTDGSIDLMVAISDQAFAVGKAPDSSLELSHTLRKDGLQTVVGIGGPTGLEGLYFVYGGAMDTWYGVLVMRSNIPPPYPESHVRRWRANVWYYSEERI